MKTSLIILIVLAALALIAVMFVIGMYNKLVALRNRFKNAYRLPRPAAARDPRFARAASASARRVRAIQPGVTMAH